MDHQSVKKHIISSVLCVAKYTDMKSFEIKFVVILLQSVPTILFCITMW